MNAEEFIWKWKYARDADSTPLVGIDVDWVRIGLNSEVCEFSGRTAWEKIYDLALPWFNQDRGKPIRVLLSEDSKEYLKVVREEQEKQPENKFEYIREVGLVAPLSPSFVAFADFHGSRGVLGDGCHRFVVADHLIRSEGLDLSGDLERTELDTIYLENLDEVIPFVQSFPDLRQV